MAVSYRVVLKTRVHTFLGADDSGASISWISSSECELIWRGSVGDEERFRFPGELFGWDEAFG